MVASLDFPDAHGCDFDTEPCEGFAVRLPTAQLADLVQINCLNRVRGVFRVRSGLAEGHLFFAAGQLVHADFGAAIGLDAVVVMLGLRGGSIEPCERPWPATSTIDMGADALLLTAAQRLDESLERRFDPGREVTTKVVRISQELLSGARPSESADSSAAPAEGPNNLVPGPSLPPSEALLRLAVARVGLDGSIQKLTSGAAADLADTAFYCQQVAELIGDALGLGPCEALALESDEEGIIVFRGRSIVGVRGSRVDLEFVRAKVGLV
ncbi:MAG: DUF4388 domain-containing protein [Deltaproteobacteria bacterium]